MNQDLIVILASTLISLGLLGGLIRKQFLHIVLSFHMVLLGVLLLMHAIAKTNALSIAIIIAITFCVLTIQAASVALFVFRQHGTTEIDTLRDSGG